MRLYKNTCIQNLLHINPLFTLLCRRKYTFVALSRLRKLVFFENLSYWLVWHLTLRNQIWIICQLFQFLFINVSQNGALVHNLSLFSPLEHCAQRMLQAGLLFEKRSFEASKFGAANWKAMLVCSSKTIPIGTTSFFPSSSSSYTTIIRLEHTFRVHVGEQSFVGALVGCSIGRILVDKRVLVLVHWIILPLFYPCVVQIKHFLLTLHWRSSNQMYLLIAIISLPILSRFDSVARS